MTAKQSKNQLGKGMGALLGANAKPISNKANPLSNSEKTSVASQSMVPIDKIITNKEQPRKIFSDKDIAALAASIKQNGFINPLTVSQEGGSFHLIAGERRLRAAKSLGLELVPVVVKKVTAKESMVLSIIENVQRSDLNCVEEALAYHQLMNEFSLTQEEVAKQVGKERSSIANFLRILRLPREVLRLLQKETLSFGHAKVLSAVKEDEAAIRLANEAVEKNMSVRELEKLIRTKSKTKAAVRSTGNSFYNEKLDGIKGKLEKVTGFHIDYKSKKSGSGEIIFKFNNEAELNDIYSFLIQN